MATSTSRTSSSETGVFSGIIDFGEIRGADLFYDLGHFALHDGETIKRTLLPSLLEGYFASSEHDFDVEMRIHRWAVLIGVAALARAAAKPPSDYQTYLVKAVQRSLDYLDL